MSDNEDLDLFGEDPQAEEEAKKLAEEKKKLVAEKLKKAEERAAKKRAEAKSIVVFDVKVYESDEDFEKLAKEIKEKVVFEGLTWQNSHKIVPIGYGMNKLQLTMIVMDEVVCVDDVFDKIKEDWEDNVQSIDIDSFNKA